MIKIINLCLITIFSLNNLYAQNIYGKGEILKSGIALVDRYLSEYSGFDTLGSVLVFEFFNEVNSNIDTLVIYDDNFEFINLKENRYAKYKGCTILIKGIPDTIFFNFNADYSRLISTVRCDREVTKSIMDSISKQLYNGHCNFVPKNEITKVRHGIYNGKILIPDDYDSYLFYYVYYYNDIIINTVRSDVELLDDYRWVPIK